MPINELYHTWFMKIRQLQPTERITRIRNFTWLMVGIHQSRSVYLNRIARKIPENGDESLPSSARCVGFLLGFENQTVIRDFITILGCKLNQFWVSGIAFVCNMCSEDMCI